MVELVKGWTELRYLFIVWYRVGMGRRGMSKRFLFSISVCDKKEEENRFDDRANILESLWFYKRLDVIRKYEAEKNSCTNDKLMRVCWRE